VAIVWVLTSRVYDDQTIVRDQAAQQRRIGTPTVNEQLYRAVKERSIQDPILTTYWYLRALPDLESLFRPLTCSDPCSYDALLDTVKRHPSAGYVLLYDAVLDADAHRKLASRPKFQTVFLQDGLRFLYINRTSIQRVRSTSTAEFVDVEPSAGEGANSTFRVRYSDPGEMIESVIVIVNRTLDPKSACYFEWDRRSNVLTIANDSGAGWAAERKLGTLGSIHNSQCEINIAGAAAASSSGKFELVVPVRFSNSFHGPVHLYSTVTGNGWNSPFREGASWTVN
jgi:hypothetical protein